MTKMNASVDLSFLRRPSYWAKLIGVFIVYFFTAKFGLSLDAVSGFATLIWPPTGIAFAAVLVFGSEMAPGIALAAFLINLLSGASLVAAFGIALGNTLEALIGVSMLRHLGFDEEFKRARDTYLYVAIAALSATIIAATIGTTTLRLTGSIVESAYRSTWIAWWTGDMLGALIVGYFLLNIIKTKTLRGVRMAEAISMFTVFIVVNAAYFFGLSWVHSIVGDSNILNLSIIILLFYFAIRFGSIGAGWTLFAVLAIGVAGTMMHLGPYQDMTLLAGLKQLQSGLGWVGGLILLLASISDERRTSRQEAEKAHEELREKSAVLEEAERLAGIGSGRWDFMTDKIVVSDQLCRIFDVTKEEFKGSFPEVMQYFHEEDRAAIGEQVTRALETREPFQFETRVTTKTGATRDIRVSCRFILDVKGHPQSMMAAVRDITQDKEIERQKAREVALLESIGDGVVGVDARQRIIYVNRAALQMLGMTMEEMIGKSFFLAVRAEEEKGRLVPDSERLMVLGVELQKSLTKRAHYYVRKDGTRFPAAVTVSPVILDGKILGVVNTFRDITNEIELDRAKDELISLASHQLRTPPTGIKWFTGMLLNEEVGKINDDQRKYLKEILYNNQRMIDVVDAMLNSSRLELGTFVAELKPVNFIAILDGVLTELSADIEEKDLVINKNFPEDLPTLSLDPTLTRMIAQNLLVNAVKYSLKKGTITVNVKMLDNELTFSVRDTGLGIPKDAQQRIFTKLFRAENTRSADSAGSGLGLYIVKRILEKIGGNISFVSEENNGTEFFVRLPAHIPSHLDKIAG